MNSPEWCQRYWNRISHRVCNKNRINKGRNLLVRSLCEQCCQLCNTVEVFKVTQQENGQDRRTRSTSSPLPWPSAQIPSSTYSLITPVDQWLASNGLLLITGSKCRICPFYTTFLRKSSALIWHFLWMTSDYHKQQVLLSGQHILLLDQPGKMYRGFCRVLCWFSPWLSLLVGAEWSSCPPHTLKRFVPAHGWGNSLSFSLSSAFEKGERNQLSFPVYGWDQVLSCMVIPWSFPLGMER